MPLRLTLKEETKSKKWELHGNCLFYVENRPFDGLALVVKRNQHSEALHSVQLPVQAQGTEILRGKISLTDGHRFNQGFTLHEEISFSYIENALKHRTLFSRDMR